MTTFATILKKLSSLLLILLLLPKVETAQAQNNAGSLIIDAEISHTLAQIATPLLPSLGDASQRMSLHVLWGKDINAFVTAGTHVVFLSGLIRATDNVEELRAVMAHEFGHVLADHYALTVSERERANRVALLLALASIPLSLVSREAAIANAIASPQAIINLTLAERRARETIADSSALRILENANLSPKGLTSFLKKLGDEKAKGYAAYLQSHPPSQDRIAFLARSVAQSPNLAKVATSREREDFERMRAKLDAFTLAPRATLKKYAKSKKVKSKEKNLAATLARAIAYHRQEKQPNALEELVSLLKQKPNDPFFFELQGDILRAREPRKAQAAYRKALRLFEQKYKRGYDLPIRISLFDSLLASTDIASADSASTDSASADSASTDSASADSASADENAVKLSKELEEAENLMRVALVKNPDSILARRRLARLYDRQGKNGARALLWAEALWLGGQKHKAYCNAKEAALSLPQSSPARLRAEDLTRQVLANRKRGEKFACS